MEFLNKGNKTIIVFGICTTINMPELNNLQSFDNCGNSIDTVVKIYINSKYTKVFKSTVKIFK